MEAFAVKDGSEGRLRRGLRFRYVSCIATTPEDLWKAPTDPERAAQYWGHRNISAWQPGSSWEHRRPDEPGTVDIHGTIVHGVPPTWI